MSTLHLLILTGVYCLLTSLPIATGIVAAARFATTNWLLQLMYGLATLGILGFATFWVYLASPAAGRPFAFGVNVLCLLVLVWSFSALDSPARAGLRTFLAPAALVASAATFNLTLGFLHGGQSTPGTAAANRYVNGLPGDNLIPWDFAQALRSSVRPLPSPLVADWQSSDRPPLQTGTYLLQNSIFGRTPQVDYEVLGVIAQSLWIFGLWALLRSAGAGRGVTALCLTGSLFSGFTILNSFFV